MTSKTAFAETRPMARGVVPILRVFGELRFHGDGEILALAFASPDTLWSVEEPGILRQWDAPAGRQKSCIFLSDVETLWTFSGDACLLASASDELTLWETAGARLLASLPQHCWITALAFRKDASMLASGHDDGTVRLWDVADRKLLRSLENHRVPISAAAFSPDGTRLAAAGEDRIISLWNIADGSLLGKFVGHTDHVHALAWHPDGRILVSAGWDTMARIWNADTFEPIILLNDHADQVTALAFSPDGGLLACADSNDTVRVWDHAVGKTVGVLRQHDDEVRCLAFAPDGRRIASGGADRLIHVWDPRQTASLAGKSEIIVPRFGLALGRDGRRLASTCCGGALQAWDTDSGQLVPLGGDENVVQIVAASPDGRWLAGGDIDKRISLWDAATGELHATFMGQKGDVTALAFSPDSRTLASASATDGLVWVWNLDSREPILVIPEAADNCVLEALAFHPDGRLLAAGGIDWLATGGSDGALLLWDVVDRSLVASFDGASGSVSFHPSGRWLASTSLSESVFVWDIETHQQAAELFGHADVVNSAVYSPDGRWLATGSDDRTICLWRVGDYAPSAQHEFDTQIKVLCFSPDSRFLFTGNGNTTSYQLDVSRLLKENS